MLTHKFSPHRLWLHCSYYGKKMTKSQPVLILGCSDKKANVKGCRAFDMYTGGLFQLIKSQLDDPRKHFRILILSAKYGLLNADDYIETYNERMCSKTDILGTSNFLLEHQKNALKVLRDVSRTPTLLFVTLTNDYLSMFEQIIKKQRDSLLSRFSSHYFSENHVGIGELRGRLSKIIKHVTNDKIDNRPIVYRSGISNSSELGYFHAGCDLGCSLAHTNFQKNKNLFLTLLSSTKHNRLFIDNGLITMLGQGKEIEVSWVFKEYKKIISSLPLNQTKNISIVIPDDISSNENAINILTENKKDILWLSERCTVILPIHKSIKIGVHGINMMKALNYAKGICLGIPCLTNISKGLDLALSVSDIDRLLSLKSPNGEKLFNSCHYFGMSDVSSPKKLNPRLLVAKLNGLRGTNIALDCCRTMALFGYTKTGLRKGSQLSNIIGEEHLRSQVVHHETYVNHSYRDEYYDPCGEPFCTQQFYDMITHDEVFAFWDIYNQIMEDQPMLQMNSIFSPGEESEAMELAWQLTSSRTVDHIIYERLKLMNWANFKSVIGGVVELSPSDKRSETIRQLFMDSSMNRAIQLPLMLTA